jgi:hypothetical protein
MDSQQERELLRGFQKAMFDIYDAATRLKPPYRPTAFRGMLVEHGGKETADRLLASNQPSSGFTELFRRGRENLRLSVEYLVLTDPWHALFTPDQLATAHRRLSDVGFEPPQAPLSGNATAIDEAPVDVPLPEELPANTPLHEGAIRQITINAYERSPAARAACISHHGTACTVCGFDFARSYGPVAEGFIHVHHLVPIASIGESYEVDPIQDLRPVCPNCHAVIHHGGTCRSIEAVQRLLRR